MEGEWSRSKSNGNRSPEERASSEEADAATLEVTYDGEVDDGEESGLGSTSPWDPTASPPFLRVPLSRKRKSESDYDSDETHFTEDEEEMASRQNDDGRKPTRNSQAPMPSVHDLDTEEQVDGAESQAIEYRTQTCSENLILDYPTTSGGTSSARAPIVIVPSKVQPGPFDDGSSTDFEVEFKREEKVESQEEPEQEEVEGGMPPATLQAGINNNNRNGVRQNFYGEVEQTVEILAASIPSMPQPHEEDVQLRLPPGLVRLFVHQKYALRWMLWREGQFLGGGILADEMGLGKTTFIIALIMKSKMDAAVREIGEKGPGEVGNRLVSGATLIISQAGSLGHWESEIKTHGKNLEVIRCHGSKRSTSARELARADVLLSTYKTIATEISNAAGGARAESPLNRIQLKRIVLDKADDMGKPDSVTAKALYSFNANYRWAVTGTPVHIRPLKLYYLVKFLRLAPFDDFEVWKKWIVPETPNRNSNTLATVRRRLKSITGALILRRTKDEVREERGNAIPIPEKTVVVVEVELPEEERMLYEALMTYSKHIFKQFLLDKKQMEKEIRRRGPVQGRRRFEDDNKGKLRLRLVHISALLTRLRQCSVHPSLLKKKLEDTKEEEASQVLNKELLNVIGRNHDRLINDNYESAKFKKILEDLEVLRQQDKMEGRSNMDKVIIVSSWDRLLNILNEHLQMRNFTTVIAGQRSSEARRSEAQEAFNGTASAPRILLLSLMVAGEKLNVVKAANHVFFVEPHWNPQLELLVQDSVHRVGQTKDVFIRKYICTGSGSIEKGIKELQEMKTKLAENVFDSNNKNLAEDAGPGITPAQMKHLFDINDKDLVPEKKKDDNIWFDMTKRC